jgi:hypothetical protein
MKMPKELLDRAQDLHLAIHVGRQHVYAALYDFLSATCFWNVQAEVPPGLSVYKFIYQRNWMEGVFRRCSVTFDTDCYALVPATFFDPSAAEDYIQMQHGITGINASFTEIHEAESVVCYEIPEWQTDLMRYFPNARVMPACALLLRLAAARRNQTRPSFFVIFSSDSISIAAIKEKEIELLSTHEARTAEDALYHLSNAAMRLQIDPENCHIELLDTSENFELVELLRKYFGNVSELVIHKEMKASPVTQIHYLCA